MKDVEKQPKTGVQPLTQANHSRADAGDDEIESEVESADQDNTETQPVTRADRLWAQLQGVREELRNVSAQLAELEEEKAELERRALKLHAKIEVLEPICSELSEEETSQKNLEWSRLAQVGIQECCYRVLLESDGPMDAGNIRCELEEAGIEMDRYANPLAVIHTSLKRIPDRVRSFRQKDKAYGTSAAVWVRYYEAIRSGAETKTPPSK